MRTTILIALVCYLSLAVGACGRRAASPGSSESQTKPGDPSQESNVAKFDVCGLIKNEEIEAVQGSPVKEAKSTGRSNRGLQMGDCFYMTMEFSRSIDLSVTRSDPDSPTKGNLKDVWRKTFGGGQEKEREDDRQKSESLRDQSRERGEEESKAKKIEGIGEEAYWMSTRVGGALYVLKKDAFIRIGIGGADNDETRLNKSKLLAEKALARLQ